jgi:hypothetical protein
LDAFEVQRPRSEWWNFFDLTIGIGNELRAQQFRIPLQKVCNFSDRFPPVNQQ